MRYLLFWSKKKNVPHVSDTRRIARDAAGDSLQVVPSNYQNVGARENQEDSFALSDYRNKQDVEVNGVLAVVADGMGGLSYGEEASRVAVQIFVREYANSSGGESVPGRLNRSISVANTAVFDLAYNGRDDYDLGTTMVAAALFKDQLYWISVGDSRIYLFRDEELKQLSNDHIYANHLEIDVANGKISRDEANNHPEKDYLTSYLGLPSLTEIDQNYEPLQLKGGDIILLCSDGLYDTMQESEIVATLKRRTPNISEELVKTTIEKNNKYQDNVTVITLKFIDA